MRPWETVGIATSLTENQTGQDDREQKIHERRCTYFLSTDATRE
jgi:hypothetical protein